jgi:hypothetical protein
VLLVPVFMLAGVTYLPESIGAISWTTIALLECILGTLWVIVVPSVFLALLVVRLRHG